MSSANDATGKEEEEEEEEEEEDLLANKRPEKGIGQKSTESPVLRTSSGFSVTAFKHFTETLLCFEQEEGHTGA